MMIYFLDKKILFTPECKQGLLEQTSIYIIKENVSHIQAIEAITGAKECDTSQSNQIPHL